MGWLASSLAQAGDLGEVLARRVDSSGVDYAGWKASAEDRKTLVDFTESAAIQDLGSYSREEKMAFLINAYNAWMLRLVLEKYPVASVKDIAPNFGVFSRPLIRVAGREMSLNDLEKGWLLKEFKEPRVHFAVNCASRSCPPLLPKLWKAETLEADLEAAARDYLTRNPLGVDPASGRISQIFEWYAADFSGREGVRSFLKKYRPVPEKLAFLEYDWTLNSKQ
ncbi:MAG: DUF547 domain-containing protein [Terrimicrobiaceae bacterium]|nr:DUF547 domain-containing protein [Terrimicrobiaceae bacterium]